MKQAKLNKTGDLIFSFKKKKDNDNVVVYKLENDAELEFVDGECIAMVLPSFVEKLNRGQIDNVELESIDLIDDVVHFTIDIGGQFVNGRVSLESLKGKL